jgi:hypothetical protein
VSLNRATTTREYDVIRHAGYSAAPENGSAMYAHASLTGKGPWYATPPINPEEMLGRPLGNNAKIEVVVTVAVIEEGDNPYTIINPWSKK